MRKNLNILFEWQLLSVHPNLRGTGVAWQLYRRMEQVAKEKGAIKMICRSAAYGARKGEENSLVDKFTTGIEASLMSKKEEKIFDSIPVFPPIASGTLDRQNIYTGIKITKDLEKIKLNTNLVPNNFIEEIVPYLSAEEISNSNIESWTIRWKQKDTNYMAKTWFLILKGGVI